jgi:glutathione S-transferase
MPVLVLSGGETLIESSAILDYLDEIAGPSRALIPATGEERRKSLRILASATAACDKAIAINYERRRPQEMIFVEWIVRCRAQLNAALSELEVLNLEPDNLRPLRQIEITTTCMFGYIQRVEPDAVSGGRYPMLNRLSAVYEARQEFKACAQ